MASICASSARAPVLQRLDLCGHGGVAVEEVAVFQQVGFIGEDLLHPQRPLLIPGARQAERLVPGGQLHGAGAGVLRQRHGQHFQQDAVDVVFRLLLGQAQRVDLHAVAEAAEFRVFDAVAVAVISSHSSTKARILHISVTKRMPALTKKEMRPTISGKSSGATLALQVVEHGGGGGQRKGQFLFRRRACLLQVVGTDVHRVPFRQVLAGIGGDIGDHPQAGRGRADIGAARQVFLDDVVLHGALQRGDTSAPCSSATAI